MWTAEKSQGFESRKCRNRVVSYLRGDGLDLGCGDGSVLIQLQQLGFKKLFGVDKNSYYISKLKKQGFNVVRGDVTKVPLKGKFDFVFKREYALSLYDERGNIV